MQGKDLTRVDQRDCAKGDEKKLREACGEFEALFIYMVMKQMRKTIPQTKLIDGGKGEEIFTSMMDEELSRQMSLRQGLGLKDVLIEQLSGKRKGEWLMLRWCLPFNLFPCPFSLRPECRVDPPLKILFYFPT